MNWGLWSIVICCLLASSIEPILVKVGFLGGVSPLLLIILRFIFAGSAVAAIGGPQFFKELNYKTYKRILPLALLLLLTNSLTIAALIFSNPSLVITIITITPAAVGFCSYLLGYEEINTKFWLGVLCSFIGVLIAVNSQLALYDFSHLKGACLSFLAVVSSTAYRMLLGRISKEIPPKTISSYIFINNGLLGLVCLPFFYQEISWKLGSIAVWTGLAAVCANVAFIYAVKQVGAARMSVIDLLQRPLVVVFSMLILGETISANQIGGIILVGTGVYLANLGKSKATALKMDKL